MSSTKDKFRKAFTKFKSTKPPLDPGEIDKMKGEDEEKLALLTNWADAEEKLLRGLRNPRITGSVHHGKNVTTYNYTGPTRTIKQAEWTQLIDQALKYETTNEPVAKQLMQKLNALYGVSCLLGGKNTYATRFEKARDLEFLCNLCKTR